MAWKSRKANIKNLKIKEIMNVQYKIIERIEERRLRWFGYLKRMRNNRISEVIMQWNVVIRWEKGKPKEP